TVRAGDHSATTDADGFYRIVGLSPGTYALQAEKPACVVEPAQRMVTLPPDRVDQDFSAICMVETKRVFLPFITR
ncbi:MAG: carboxypeptidase-like regulatory domain-containing protein, partial [Roseiflexus sp.]